MAQKLLDGTEIRAVVQQVRGKSVAESVGSNVLVHGQSLAALPQDILNTPG